MDALTIRREKCNLWYSQALYSRRNASHTPVMLIMQRLHEMDLVGYVQDVEGDLWHVLSIPVMDDEDNMLWPETFSADSARRMRRLDPFAFSAQYMQAPTPAGGAMIKRDWIQNYTGTPPKIIRYGIFADTAQKTGQQNDYTVFLCAGTDGNNAYVLDLVRDRLEAPDLIETAKKFWKRHQPNRISNPARFIGFFIEDKVSGTGLIQTLRRETNIPVMAMSRDRDKVSRVNDILPYVRAGRLYVPEDAPWVKEYIAELVSFSPAMTHLHDDQVDPTCDALNELLSPRRGADTECRLELTHVQETPRYHHRRALHSGYEHQTTFPAHGQRTGMVIRSGKRERHHAGRTVRTSEPAWRAAACTCAA